MLASIDTDAMQLSEVAVGADMNGSAAFEYPDDEQYHLWPIVLLKGRETSDVILAS